MAQDRSGSNAKQHFTEAEIAEKVKAVLAELLEIDVGDIQDQTRLTDDLGADSLLYLELFEELKDAFNLGLDLHEIGRYATRHPVATVKELTGLVKLYIEKGDELLRELDEERVDSAQ